jgi:excisionase family DNA binding protein
MEGAMRDVSPCGRIEQERQCTSQNLTVAEVAGILRVTTKTVRDWARAGKLKSFTIGRKILFPADSLPGKGV